MKPHDGWRIIPLASLLALLIAAGCSPDGTAPEQEDPVVSGTSGPEFNEVESYASVTIAEEDRTRISRIAVIPSHALVPAGGTVAFFAIAYDEGGNALGPNETETRWSMTDPQAGAITRTGIFHGGVQRGVFNNSIEVTMSQVVDGSLVTLQTLASVSILRSLSDLDISRVQVLPEEVQLRPATEVVLAALALDRTGVPVQGVELTWAMLDANAGSINPDGRFTSGDTLGSFPGAIRVVAQKKGDPTQVFATTVSVVVRELGVLDTPSKVNLYPQAVSLRPGDTIEFRVLTLDERGNLFEDIETVWELNDPSAGELDSQGRFHAGAIPGNYPNLVEVTVTPRGMDEPITLQATATVTVLEAIEAPGQLERLLLTPEILRLRTGESIKITAAALTRSGDLAPSPTLRWSGQENVLEVSPDGVVTAIGQPGTYRDALTVEATIGEGAEQTTQTASATVTILGPLFRVEIVPREVQVTPGQLVQFTYIAYDVNGVRLFDVLGSWEVTDETAGSINGLGLFTAGDSPAEYQDVIKVVVKRFDLGTGGLR